MNTSARAGGSRTRRNALVDWFLNQRLLRGPHLYVDYWANVLGLEGVIPAAHLRSRLIDPALFRAGLDRPDLEVPRLRFYILLFLIGPLIFPFRAFRRLGRYRIRFLGPVGDEIQRSLRSFRLRLRRTRSGRVDVFPPRSAARAARSDDTASNEDEPIASNLIDPFRVSAFCSLFWAAHKLPLASFSAILAIAVLAPALASAGLLDIITRFWIPVGYPLLVILLRLFYREWVTAILGALPVIFGRYVLRFAQPASIGGWLNFVWPLAALFLLYLVFDLFFTPRPVPPVLMLYTSEGAGNPYARQGDAPYWLEGKSYWVWRYLILSPAEVNKFWERDWERVDLWVRADGADAGRLEWAVTDLHYRELWIPYAKLGSSDALARQTQTARDTVAAGEPGVWVVEVDADLLVHYPYVRGVAFLPQEHGVPVRGMMELLRALWTRIKGEPSAAELVELERLRLRLGRDVLADVPEFVARRVSRHLMGQPWTYWRYPLGAATRAEPRLYGAATSDEPPLAADPRLQIKS